MKKVGETDWKNARGVYLSDGVVTGAPQLLQDEGSGGKRGRNFVAVHHSASGRRTPLPSAQAIEAAAAGHWMGEAAGGTGFYEVKFHDPTVGRGHPTATAERCLGADHRDAR